MDHVKLLAPGGDTHSFARIREENVYWFCQKQVETLMVGQGIITPKKFRYKCNKVCTARIATPGEKAFCIQSGAVPQTVPQVMLLQLSEVKALMRDHFRDKNLEAMFQTAADATGQRFSICKQGKTFMHKAISHQQMKNS